jgi:hypothetical protein
VGELMELEKANMLELGKWYKIRYYYTTITFSECANEVYRRLKYINLAEDKLIFFDNWHDIEISKITKIRKVKGWGA